MKNLLLILLLLVPSIALSQGMANVQKTGSGANANDITGDLNIGASKTLTIKSGGTLTIASGATFNPIITGLPATSIADGSVSNAEFQYLGGVTSDLQTQLDGKVSTGPYLGPYVLGGAATGGSVPASIGAASNGQVLRRASNAIAFGSLDLANSTTWGGTVLPVANGGTNIASYAAGDTLFASGATTLTKLAKGTALQVYRMNAGATAPEWVTLTTGITIGDAIASGSNDGVLFQDGSGNLAQDADFTFSGDTLTATKFATTQATITGGTVTASTPVATATQTWNDSGVVFTGQSSTITRTAAATGSKLFDHLISGIGSVMSLQYNTGGGGNSPYRLVFGADTSIGFDSADVQLTVRNAANSAYAPIQASVFNATSGVNSSFYVSVGDKVYAPDNAWDSPHGVRVASDSVLAFSSTTAASGAVDLALTRLSANHAKLTNGSSGDGHLTLGNLTQTAGSTLSITSGSNQRAGNATLVGGTVTVNNTSVTANTIVMLSRKTAGGVTGELTYTVSAATSFTINASVGTDTSTVSYLLIEVP